jgi:macrolide transport system ATP-binding/permease protein
VPVDQAPARPRLLAGIRDRFSEAFAMALRSMNAHRLRTFLTMLGIIIGTASVVCVVALGQGSQKQILDQISDLGTNTLYISPGKGFGDLKAALITTLNLADAAE